MNMYLFVFIPLFLFSGDIDPEIVSDLDEYENFSSRLKEQIKVIENYNKDESDLFTLIGRLRLANRSLQTIRRILNTLSSKKIKKLVSVAPKVNTEYLYRLNKLKDPSQIVSEMQSLVRLQDFYVAKAKDVFSSLSDTEVTFLQYLATLPDEYRPPIQSYVDNNGVFHPGIDRIISYVRQGDKYLKFLYSDKTSNIPKKDESIISIQWSLYKKTLEYNDWKPVEKMPIKVQNAYKLYEFFKSMGVVDSKYKESLPGGGNSVDFGLDNQNNFFIKWKGVSGWKTFFNKFMNYFKNIRFRILTPEDLIEYKFFSLVKGSNINLTKPEIIVIKRDGIKEMINYLKKIKNPNLLKEFESFLKTQNLYKDLDSRKSDEPIITLGNNIT